LSWNYDCLATAGKLVVGTQLTAIHIIFLLDNNMSLKILIYDFFSL